MIGLTEYLSLFNINDNLNQEIIIDINNLKEFLIFNNMDPIFQFLE